MVTTKTIIKRTRPDIVYLINVLAKIQQPFSLMMYLVLNFVIFTIMAITLLSYVCSLNNNSCIQERVKTKYLTTR